MAGPKVDKLTKERRVEAVYRLILDGWTPEQIRANTAEWGLGPAQVGLASKSTAHAHLRALERTRGGLRSWARGGYWRRRRD